MQRDHKTDNVILLLMAFGGVLIHILLNGQYGFHRDELDVILNARQLDWGYVAYPPLTPFLARIEPGTSITVESSAPTRVCFSSPV